jgi:ATP-dependent Clp protease ATP-binding subunit ClpA
MGPKRIIPYPGRAFAALACQLPFPARTATRLQACLDSASQHARAEGTEEIGTQHLLAGLMAEGVAAAILENLHVNVEAIRGSSRRLFDPSPAPATDEIPPMSTEPA